MRISTMWKVTAISAALVASTSLPAAAIETTWADVREGSGGDTGVEASLLTAAREAPGTFELSPVTSFASEREYSPTDSGPSYSTLAYVREAAPATDEPSISAWASVREAVDPAAAVAANPVQSQSDIGDEIIVGSALAAVFLLGAGLGILISRRRMPSVA
jgi:hypothetical protein